MNMVAFDTHKFVKRLTEAGFTPAQAETLAEEQSNLIESNLATKRDLKEVEASLKHDIALVQRDIELVRRDMKEGEGRLKNELTIRLAVCWSPVSPWSRL